MFESSSSNIFWFPKNIYFVQDKREGHTDFSPVTRTSTFAGSFYPLFAPLPKVVPHQIQICSVAYSEIGSLHQQKQNHILLENPFFIFPHASSFFFVFGWDLFLTGKLSPPSHLKGTSTHQSGRRVMGHSLDPPTSSI